jgi:hypothetical protein
LYEIALFLLYLTQIHTSFSPFCHYLCRRNQKPTCKDEKEKIIMVECISADVGRMQQ